MYVYIHTTHNVILICFSKLSHIIMPGFVGVVMLCCWILFLKFSFHECSCYVLVCQVMSCIAMLSLLTLRHVFYRRALRSFECLVAFVWWFLIWYPLVPSVPGCPRPSVVLHLDSPRWSKSWLSDTHPWTQHRTGAARLVRPKDPSVEEDASCQLVTCRLEQVCW